MDLVTLQDGEDVARKGRQIRRKILQMQQAFSNIEAVGLCLNSTAVRSSEHSPKDIFASVL